jgi:NADH dehydrogenase
MPKVVVIGGGFGGLACARRLQSRTPSTTEIVIIDRRNHHLFQPLLYQVAMAGLSPAEIAAPIRSILSRGSHRISVIMGNVQKVDLKSRRVFVDTEEITYDYLVMACGAMHSYFGHEPWEKDAPGLKTLEQATEIRRRVLLAFERAERCQDIELQKQLLTFAVIGGGPTSVELAGALGEISRYTLSRDFLKIDPRRTRVILIEAGPRILPSLSAELSQRAARDLENIGVTVWTSTRVTDVRDGEIELGGEKLRAGTVMWAAGVRPSELNVQLGLQLDSTGRVVINQRLEVDGHENVFVIGDQSNCKDKNGKPLPGLAPVAMQQGRFVADAIKARIAGKTVGDFHYTDKGQMATIGRKRAVAEIGNFKMSGFMAYLAWIFVHIYYLIGFKNKLFVIFQWGWSYFLYKRGARLIVDKEWRSFSGVQKLTQDS